MKVFDLRKIASACGDYTLYVLAELDKLESGEKLKVIVAKSAKEVLDETISSIEKSNAAKVIERGEESNAYYAVLEKR
ncbi:hypothetical protein PYJP_11820 [Pyrofollis japonicus]|uniref:hypothetical protein n=1 Tax=Pyrofollis japonicus TaxID=3060460 RepID=UPI00295B039C|nr:hypothetical protein [Pyrofollis japonicus]BEP17830.1 hypothetical protein PYJP_11820 [Pyrofollis japonicus]